MQIYLFYSRLCIIFAANFEIMADFYVNYGSKGAQLVANYCCNNINLKLHRTNNDLFVLSKNRKIIFKCKNLGLALNAFHNVIYLDQPGNDLFNN